jgi:fibronectin type 3 domain-containing protein
MEGVLAGAFLALAGCTSGGDSGAPGGTPESGASSHSVLLKWEASPTPSVTYDLYRGTTPGGPYTQILSGITTTSTTDTTVSPGTTYYYVARSQDSAGQSVDSNEVQAAIP